MAQALFLRNIPPRAGLILVIGMPRREDLVLTSTGNALNSKRARA